MSRDRVLKIVNILFPLIGIGAMVLYEVCTTSCSSLRGTFLGLDLKVAGIVFMAALLGLTLPQTVRRAGYARHVRTLLLSGALGGEVLLVRFQVVHDTYCSFCLAFGLCVLILAGANLSAMNRYLALGAFLAGLAAFALFFQGTAVPTYG